MPWLVVTSSSTHKLSQKTRDAGLPGASALPQLLCLRLEHVIFSLPGTWEVFLHVRQSLTLQQKEKKKVK